MDPSRPPEADGSSNGAPHHPSDEIDDFLASLLTGEVRVKVDPASGKIVEGRDDRPSLETPP